MINKYCKCKQHHLKKPSPWKYITTIVHTLQCQCMFKGPYFCRLWTKLHTKKISHAPIQSIKKLRNLTAPTICDTDPPTNWSTIIIIIPIDPFETLYVLVFKKNKTNETDMSNIFVVLTLFSALLITRTMWRRISLHPKNLSRGARATCSGSCCSWVGFRSVSNASWDSNVGVEAAHWRWGSVRDGGLITEI